MSTSSTNLLVSKHPSPPREPGLLGEVPDSKTGAKKMKVSLEHLVVSESKKVLKKRGTYCRKTGDTLKESLLAKAGTMCTTN